MLRVVYNVGIEFDEKIDGGQCLSHTTTFDGNPPPGSHVSLL
jgi:hypothetical protein